MKKSKVLRKCMCVGEFSLFVVPILFFLILIELLPFVKGFLYSLTDWDGYATTYNFVGLQNYINALKSGSPFWKYFKLTIRFVVVIVPITNVISIALAAVLSSQKLRTTTFARVSLFTPHVISVTVIAFLWQFMFTTVSGSLADTTGLKFLDLNWFSDPKLAFWSVCIVSIWSSVGFNMIIYIAGLQTVDDSILEAARIDGASTLQQFFRIKLPMIMSSVTVCLFLSLANAFKMFDLPYFLTHGGPGGSTTTIALSVYNEAYSQQRYGVSTTYSILLFIIILIVTLLQTTLTERKEVNR